MPDTQYIQQTNTTTLPPWMQQSIQDILGRATGIANEPYQAYQGPTVAPFSQDQLASFQGIRNLQTAPYANWLGIGSAYAGQAGAVDATDDINSYDAGRPMFDAATGMFNNVAGADTAGIAAPLIGEGSDYLRRSTEGSGAASANPYIQQSISPMGISMGSPYIQSSAAPTGLAAASPYLGMAGTSFPGMADAYMNPYMRNVTDEIARLGGRNLSENLLPQISDQFVRSGQFGSAQQRDVVGRALRDTNESILGQQAQALQQGYGQAGQLYGQDAARYAGLAGTAGGLGTAQQQAQLQAGQALGGLGQGQQQLLQNAGTALGGLTSADLQRLQAAGINLGQFGISQAGLAAADQQRALAAAQGIAGIGQSAMMGAQADAARNAQSTQATAGNMLGAASSLGNLGTAGNAMGLQNAAALGAAGDQQQGQVQANYNAGQQAFNQQQQYPWQNLGNLSSIIHGLPMSQSSTGTTTTTNPSPSVVSQVGGLALGGLGLANSGIFRAKGGAVRKYNRGGCVAARGIGGYRMAA